MRGDKTGLQIAVNGATMKSNEGLFFDFKNTIIAKEKFTQYALNYDKAPNKAKAFELALGYTKDNADELIKNILDHLSVFAAVSKGKNDFGELFEVEMLLMGPNGKKATVITGWIVEIGFEKPRLTIAYVSNRTGGKTNGD
jgi:hypothetical protein